MKIVVTGSLGNVSRPLTIRLVAAGHEVIVVTSDAAKQNEIRSIGATAAVGLLTDVPFLKATFKGADALYAMVPTDQGAADVKGYIAGIGKNYAAAIEGSGVRKVVLLSSVGAHLSDGAGPIDGIHRVEKVLKGIPDVTLITLRAGFFYLNLLANIPLIKAMNCMGGNTAPTDFVALVHPEDIADAAFNALQDATEVSRVEYVVSDESTNAEVAQVLGSAIGKPHLQWVQFTEQQAVQGMVQGGVPERFAKVFMEIGHSIRNGKLWEDYLRNKPNNYGKVKLKDFAAMFAQVYGNG